MDEHTDGRRFTVVAPLVLNVIPAVHLHTSASRVDIMDTHAGFSFGAHGVHFGIVGLPELASIGIVRCLGLPALPFSGEPIASLGRAGSVCVSWVIRIPFRNLDPGFLERTQYVQILGT